jgi:hypothetical protein
LLVAASTNYLQVTIKKLQTQQRGFAREFQTKETVNGLEEATKKANIQIQSNTNLRNHDPYNFCS